MTKNKKYYIKILKKIKDILNKNNYEYIIIINLKIKNYKEKKDLNLKINNEIIKNNLKIKKIYINYLKEYIIFLNNEKELFLIKKLKNKYDGILIKKIYEKNINNNFIFLDWIFYKYKNKFIIKPRKEKIKKFIKNISFIVLKKGKTATQDEIIKELNKKIKEFYIYNEKIICKKIFSDLDYIIFKILYKWAKRRHPRKSKKWVIEKYWKEDEFCKYNFKTEKNELLKLRKCKYIFF